MTGTIIQIYGKDEEPYALIHCSDKDFPEEVLRTSIEAFEWGEDDDEVEKFIESLNTKWAPAVFERLFIDTELYL